MLLLRRLVCLVFGHDWGVWLRCDGDRRRPHYHRFCYRCHRGQEKLAAEYYHWLAS